ncbi:MAG: 3-deoxy-D-manno-octulosonic acid transferase [Longimicrobiales bacterium]
MSLLYRFVWAVVRLAAPLFSIGDSKVARGLAGRRRAHEVLALWGETIRDPQRPVVWFHAPSVGEGLQAQAVIEELRAARPDLQVAFTFFSPSAVDLARGMAVDVAAYLPWDLKRPLARVLDALEPDAVVFTKTEVWPTLASEAARRAIPVAIVAATVPDGAGRTSPMARVLLGRAWSRMSLAAANSEADAEQLRKLGVLADVLEVVGDPGIDSAATRFDARNREASWLMPFQRDRRPTVVAGSTWRADEDVLLPALERVRTAVEGLRVVIAPHEPTSVVVAGLMERLRAHGWRTTTLADFERRTGTPSTLADSGPDAIVVERVGVLAELYEVATVSFVGGAFHDRGLHSVLEPAAAGSPVVFGPRHHNARAASELIADGGAKVAGDQHALAQVVSAWLLDEESRNEAGSAAVGYIDRHRGAAKRCATLLDSLISTIR